MSIAAALPRDYSLIGRDTKRAEEMGLASAEWYKAPIARKRLKELMQRSDGAAIRDTIIWIASFLVTGGLRRSLSGRAGGPCPSSSPMACSTARRAIRAGMNAATAPPSRRAG